MRGLLADVNVQGHLAFLRQALIDIDLLDILIAENLVFSSFAEIGIPAKLMIDRFGIYASNWAGCCLRKTGIKMIRTHSKRRYATHGRPAIFRLSRSRTRPNSKRASIIEESLRPESRTCCMDLRRERAGSRQTDTALNRESLSRSDDRGLNPTQSLWIHHDLKRIRAKRVPLAHVAGGQTEFEPHMRCSDVPWVNESGTTTPRACICNRSSPMALCNAAHHPRRRDLRI